MRPQFHFTRVSPGFSLKSTPLRLMIIERWLRNFGCLQDVSHTGRRVSMLRKQGECFVQQTFTRLMSGFAA